VSKQAADIRTGSVKWVRDEPGGSPFTGQAVSGTEAARVRSAASAWNVGRRMPIPRPWRRKAPGQEAMPLSKVDHDASDSERRLTSLIVAGPLCRVPWSPGFFTR
jgi:hypothetical protein